MKKAYLYFAIIGVLMSGFLLVDLALASDSNGTIDPSHKFAWGDNLGWLNFGCDSCNIHISDTRVTGFAWSRQLGWLNLSPDNGSVTNNCQGQLGGKAWSSNLGWLDFSGASIDFNGKFTGQTGAIGTKAGRLNFNCDNCDVQTDWRQCSLRSSPPQVKINAITNRIIPTISADIIMTNEGTVGTEYQYEWCVVSSESNPCGGGDDVFYASAAKFINAGQDYSTILNANVPIAGNYWFKLVAHYGTSRSVASQVFTAVDGQAGGGGGGNGGGGGSGNSGGIVGTSTIPSTSSTTKPTMPEEKATTTPKIPNETASSSPIYNVADFNRDNNVDSIDFSILLFYWGKSSPYKNKFVDINKDKKVDSIDFSILLYNWGKHTNN